MRAVVEPLRGTGDQPEPVRGIELAAVGARDLARADAAAAAWGVPIAYGSYEELLGDPDIDAVYIGTPAGLHRRWAVHAIAAGKHVLVEKPFANNATDAELIAEAAAAHPEVVVMEAFHWRYHPVATRIAEIVGSGVLGRVERVEAAFDIPVGHIPTTDIRWDLALGGGATMDLGCYSIQWVRHAVASVPGGDPAVLPEVVSATAVVPEPQIDGSLGAELRWTLRGPDGDHTVTGWVHSSMIADGDHVVAYLTVRGSDGTLTANNPLAPQTGGAELRIETAAGARVEPVAPTSTYWHQLAAFRDAIVDGTPFPSTAADGVRNMAVIDACYRAAGLELRPTLV